MSVRDEIDPGRGWRSAVKLREAEADRLAELGDEDFEEAIAALPDPPSVPTIDELIDRAKQRAGREANGVAPVRAVDPPTERGRPSPLLWLLAAAFIALLAVGTLRREAVVAWFKGPAQEPAPQAPQAPPGPTPAERAELARTEARQACVRGEFLACASKLDEAQAIDPAGEATPAVRQLRQNITDGLRRDKEFEAKPRPK
jgi:hypothetical protein